MTRKSHAGFLRAFQSQFTILAISAGIFCQSGVSVAATKMAITVDDLPIHGDILPTESRLDVAKKFVEVLRRHHVTEAYGFVNAKKVADAPESKAVLNEWIEAGFPLGNHSYSHPNLNKHTAEEFLEDVRLDEPLLKELSKGESYKWFRYPFLHEGDTLAKRDAVRQSLQQMNYRIAQVSVDFEDWAWNNPYVRCTTKGDQRKIKWLEKSYLQNALARLNYSTAQAKKLFGRDISHVLLLHIGTFDSKMLDGLLSALEQRGVQFISLADAESDAAYMENPGLTDKNGNEVLTQLISARKLRPPRVAELPFKKLEASCLN
jgi:peptidoglycan/xylan/chitin deacetylase (PgdA/CDA1 family)